MISIKGNVRRIAKVFDSTLCQCLRLDSLYTWQIITVCQLDGAYQLNFVLAIALHVVLVIAVFHKALNFLSSDWPIGPCLANRIGISQQIVFIVIIANATLPIPVPCFTFSLHGCLIPRVGCILIVVRLISKLTQMIVMEKNVLIIS